MALAFALVASAFGVAVVGLTDWSQPFASVLMLGLAAYFVANALTAIWYGVIAKRSFRQHRLLMQSLRAKRVACSGCGYWLEGCATESDGCTVCPECGAAWRLPAFGGS